MAPIRYNSENGLGRNVKRSERAYTSIQCPDKIVVLGNLWICLEMHTSDRDVVLLCKCQPFATNLGIGISVV